jgi:hypothetical protein
MTLWTKASLVFATITLGERPHDTTEASRAVSLQRNRSLAVNDAGKVGKINFAHMRVIHCSSFALFHQ